MRRRAVAAVLLGWLGAGPARATSTHSLPAAASLPAALDAALQRGRPLLVMVSLDGCPYCKVVREHHLLELMQAGQPVVQVDMRSSAPVIDFAGRLRTHDELVRAWKVTTAPTLLFLGRGGREVAARLEGVSIPDFYGAYLEQRLESARREVGASQR